MAIEEALYIFRDLISILQALVYSLCDAQSAKGVPSVCFASLHGR